MDCYEALTSRNGKSPLTVFARKSARIDEAIHRIVKNHKTAEFTQFTQIFFTKSHKDSSDSAESIKDSTLNMDCHAKTSVKSRNDEINVDCHDSATQNLAMTPMVRLPHIARRFS